MPRRVLERFSSDVDRLQFDGTCYFHASRVLDPVSFRRRGILPFPAVIDEIWETLRELAEMTPSEWAPLRDEFESDHLYRNKVEN